MILNGVSCDRLYPLERTRRIAVRALLNLVLAVISSTSVYAEASPVESMAGLCNDVASQLAVEICAGDESCSIGEAKSFVIGALGCLPDEPPISWNGVCSDETTPCGEEAGRPRTCCAKGWSCQSYGSNYWCAPEERSACPHEVRPDRTEFCGKEGQEKNICCRKGEKCTKKNDGWLNPLPTYYACEPTEESCAAPNTICGNDCCNPSETCAEYGLFFKKCSAKSCADGAELCRGVIEGTENFICCPRGTCSPSEDGNANCIHG